MPLLSPTHPVSDRAPTDTQILPRVKCPRPPLWFFSSHHTTTTVKCAKQRQCNHRRGKLLLLSPALPLGEEKRIETSRTVCCSVPECACELRLDRGLSSRHCESTRDMQPGKKKQNTQAGNFFFLFGALRLYFLPSSRQCFRHRQNFENFLRNVSHSFCETVQVVGRNEAVANDLQPV